MNSDTENLSKASNKKVKKKPYQVLYLWQGGFWLVCGQTVAINFQLQNEELTLQTAFCFNPRGQIFTRAQPKS